MRWLGLLAILVAGAAGYLVWSMSSGTSPRARASQPEVAEAEREPATPPDSAPPPPPTREVRPPVAPARQPVPLPPITRPPPSAPDLSAATPPPPADAGPPDDAPWTDEQARQRLYVARGRYEKGNYPGAIEAGMELAERYPAFAEDGWKTAIMAHCAMANPDQANELFAKMTDKPAIADLTKACTTWGVTLAQP